MSTTDPTGPQSTGTATGADEAAAERAAVAPLLAEHAEIEALMADLGEREPIEIPVGVLTGNGQQSGQPVAIGSGAGDGDGHGPAPSGDGPTGQAPPRPDLP